MPEVVGDAGLTFRNGNWEELSEKMAEALNNPELKKRLRSNRTRKLEKFNPLELSKQYLDIFWKST